MNKKERLICQKIYEENHKRINWYIWKHHSWLNEEEVHDVMQDLWKALSQDIAKVSKRTEEGQWAWLVTVVNNRVISGFRANERDRKLEEKMQLQVDNFPEDNSIENTVINRILAEKILDKLTTEEKRILFEKHLGKNIPGEEGMKRKDNATVCKTYRARKKLEKYMKDGDMDE